MPRYRLDTAQSPVRTAARPPVRQPGWRWPACAGAAALLLASVALAGSDYLANPAARAGQLFLAAASARDVPRLAALMDDSFRQAFPPAAARELLQALHARIPRAFRTTAAGQPGIEGGLPMPDRYALRVAFEEPEAARDAHKSFVVSLARQRVPSGRDRWRVEFLPTYRSLLGSLYGPAADAALVVQLQQRAGARASSLHGWRPEDAVGR